MLLKKFTTKQLEKELERRKGGMINEK